jgi:hypothetical protein
VAERKCARPRRRACYPIATLRICLIIKGKSS